MRGVNRPGFSGGSFTWEEGAMMRTSTKLSPEVIEQAVRRVFAEPSTHRKGWRSSGSRPRAAARPRRGASGCGGTSGTPASVRARARPGSRASRPLEREVRQNCVRPARISPRRRSTAPSSREGVQRRAARCARGRVDLPPDADRPVELPAACAATGRCARRDDVLGDHIERVCNAPRCRSAARTRSGGRSTAKASRWRAARGHG